MGNFIDLTGQRFERLTVIERVENDKKRQSQWKCKCDCGNESIVRGIDLKSGNTKSCGCLVREKRAESLIGRKFGKLTVIDMADDYVDKNGKRYTKWLCRCECGNIKGIRANSLIGGDTISCGCYKNSMRKENSVKNNPKVRRLYNVWIGMKERCYNPNNPNYHNYGGRGIEVCKEWISNFRNFEKWANETGFDYDAKSRGCTIERKDVNGNYCPENCCWIPLSKQGNNKRNTVHIEVDGDTFTINELSEIYGINRNTLYCRYANGDSVEDLLKPPQTVKECMDKSMKTRREKALKIKIGDEIHTIFEWSKITGIKFSTIYNRVLAGKTGEEIIKTPRKKRSKNCK